MKATIFFHPEVFVNIPIHEMIQAQREYFLSGATRDIETRRQALLKLLDAVQSREKDIEKALFSDLRKSAQETYFCETGILLGEIRYFLRHLHTFLRERHARTSLAQFPAKCFTSPEPYGVVLIMAPWNYPLLLCLHPLAGAIAAGNCVVLKPSAYAPETSRLLHTLITEIFPPEYVCVVEGGRAENSALLKEKFDSIFFTGSPSVGREVMRAAAENLTPVTLELGGKSPVLIDRTADLSLAAKRVAFGKILNAGQTCVAPDYVLLERGLKETFVAEYKKALDEFFPNGDMRDMPVIVNQKHFDRLLSLLPSETPESDSPLSPRILFGGHTDPASRFIEPTVLDHVRGDDPIMQEEIFGPILPLLEVESLSEAIAFVRDNPKPLALYLFTKDRAAEKLVLDQLSFGGGCVNDTVLHLATPYMGFGGVGNSGMGQYHGRKSIETFTHSRSILKRSGSRAFPEIRARYHPYNEKALRFLRRFLR